MDSHKEVPHLLALIDDESEYIREHVKTKLIAFGAKLEVIVDPYIASLTSIQQDILKGLCTEIRNHTFDNDWLGWMKINNPADSLEKAFEQLAYLRFGQQYPQTVGGHLDDLANTFRQRYRARDVKTLMRFLFEEEGFRSPQKDYYNPDYNNLLFVLESRRGVQLTLSCIAILVAHRLNIPLFGINVPGHFMLASFENGGMQLFNAFNRGLPVAKTSVLYMEETFRQNNTSPEEMVAEVHEIILQVLRNIIEAYCRKSKTDQAQIYARLYERLTDHLQTS